MHGNFNDYKKTETMTPKEFLEEHGIPNMPTQYSPQFQTDVNDTAKALEAYHQAKLKLLGIADVSESAEIENGRNTCNHKWVQLWSGDPDSQNMEFEGEKCRLCGSEDYPI